MKKTALLALAAFASVALAQEPPPPPPQPLPVFKESVEVRVMDLDVSVTDSKGQPVSDLAKQDFTVKLDGRPVPIDYFTRVEEGTIHAPDLAAASPDRVLEIYKKGGDAFVPRNFLIYVDSGSLSPAYKNRALDQLKDFITRLGPTDTARMVLWDRRARELTEWTSSKETLLSAVNSMERGVGMSRLQNQIQTMQQIDSTRSRSQRQMLARNYADQEALELDLMVNDMRGQLATLTPLPGKKVFLLMSGSVPMQPGLAMYDYALGTSAGFSSIGALDDRQIGPKIEDLGKAANADEVTFYTVDGWGLTVDGASAATNEPLMNRPGLAFFARQNAQSGMLSLADQTGGIALVNSNNIRGGLGKVYQDASTYYSIGVNLSSLPASGYQKIQVAVNRSGVTVRYRKGYSQLSNEERSRDIAQAALKTNISYQAISVKIQLGTATKAKKQYEQPIMVLMPVSGLTFLPEGDAMKGGAEIYVGVVDDDGRTSAIVKEEAAFTQPKDAPSDAILSYPMTLQMRKGNSRIVVNVRDKTTGKMGTARADVHIE